MSIDKEIKSISVKYGAQLYDFFYTSRTTPSTFKEFVTDTLKINNYLLVYYHGEKATTRTIIYNNTDWNDYLFSELSNNTLVIYTKGTIPLELKPSFKSLVKQFQLEKNSSQNLKTNDSDKIVPTSPSPIDTPSTNIVTTPNYSKDLVVIDKPDNHLDCHSNSTSVTDPSSISASALSTLKLTPDSSNRTSPQDKNEPSTKTNFEKSEVVANLLIQSSDAIRSNPISTITELLIDQILDDVDLNLDLLKRSLQRLTITHRLSKETL